MKITELSRVQPQLDALVAEALSLGPAEMPRICDIDIEILRIGRRHNDDFDAGQAALHASNRVDAHIRRLENGSA